MITTSYADVGVYTVTITAKLFRPTPYVMSNQVSTTFTLTVLNDCDSTILIDKTFNNMSAKVSQTPATQNIEFTDTKAVLLTNPT